MIIAGVVVGLIIIAVVLFAGKKQKTFAMQESGNERPPGFVPELINTEPGAFAGYRRSDMKMADMDTDISDVDETDLGLNEDAFDEMDMLTEEQAGLSFREVVSYIRNGDLQGLLDYSLETIQQTLIGEIKAITACSFSFLPLSFLVRCSRICPESLERW